MRRATSALIEQSATDKFLSECPTAMGAIAVGSNLTGEHPVVVLARAYGLSGF
jgi:hypothetical protein